MFVHSVLEWFRFVETQPNLIPTLRIHQESPRPGSRPPALHS